jgi:glycopeptide antibiotics resistance protein
MPFARRTHLRDHGVAAARTGYLVILALATLVPFGLDLDLDPAALSERLRFAFHPRISARDAIDATRNLVLFVGWGTLWWITATARRRASPLVWATLTGAALSVGIETLQLISETRTPSVLDVLTNTSGAFVGAGGVWMGVTVVRAHRGRKSFLGIPALIFAVSYAAAVLIESTLPPFRDITISGVYGGPLTRFRAAWRHFELRSLLSTPMLDVILFMPLGMFLVAALVEGGLSYRRAGRLAALFGIALAGAAEICHGFLGLQMQLGPFLLHSAAVALGAWIASVLLASFSRRVRGPDRPLLVLIAYAVIVCLWVWRPFLVRTDLGVLAHQIAPARWIPLQAHRPQVDLFSVSDVLASAVLYLPFGALLAVWPIRLRGAAAYVLPAVYVAALTELLQPLIASRYFDVTDILIASASAAIGWAAVRRAGFRPYGELWQRNGAGPGGSGRPGRAGRRQSRV